MLNSIKYIKNNKFPILIQKNGEIIEDYISVSQMRILDVNSQQMTTEEILKNPENVGLIDISDLNLIKIPSWIETIFPNVNSLGLYSNLITKIENLDNLRNLKELYLNENKINQINNLKNLINLEYLDLSENEITKIENLFLSFKDKNNNKIKNLLLNGNNIEKIENLDKLINLEMLAVSRNKIKKIENLDNSINLISLFLDTNQITKIEGLDKLINLEELVLSKNYIEKIENLNNNININRIDIEENQIKSLNYIDNLKNLNYFNIRNNLIKKIPEFKNINVKDLKLFIQDNPLIRTFYEYGIFNHNDFNKNEYTDLYNCYQVSKKEILTKRKKLHQQININRLKKGKNILKSNNNINNDLSENQIMNEINFGF